MDWGHRSTQRVVVDDGGRSLAFPRRHVRKARRAVLPEAAILVDVAKHVERGFDRLATLPKVRATKPARHRTTVAEARGRHMGDEHLGVVGNHRPLRREGRATREVVRPVIVGGLPGASPEAHPVDGGAGVFEVVRVADKRHGSGALTREAPVVVAGDDDLVRVRQRADPGSDTVEFFQRATAEHIAGVNKHVAFGESAEVGFECMCVRDGYDSHGRRLAETQPLPCALTPRSWLPTSHDIGRQRMILDDIRPAPHGTRRARPSCLTLPRVSSRNAPRRGEVSQNFGKTARFPHAAPGPRGGTAVALAVPMHRLSLPLVLALLGAVFLIDSSSAEAQSRPIQGVRPEIHLDAGFHGFLGVGFDLEIPIVPNGFLRNRDDELALVPGIDLLFFDARYRDQDRGFGVAPNLTAQWNIYLTRRWSIFPEAGATLLIGTDRGRFYRHYGRDRNVYADPVVAFGARFHANRRLAIVMRVGYPFGAQIGLNF